MHFVIKNRVRDSSQIKLQLIQTQRQTAIAISLIEHHLFGVNGPAFDEDAGLQHLADQRWIPIGILQLHVMTWVSFVNRQHLQHVLIVLFQKTANSIGTPICRRRADGIRTGTQRIEWKRGLQIRQRVASAKFRHFNHLAAIRFRQTQDVVALNKLLDLTNGRSGICYQSVGSSMLLTDSTSHQ